MSEQRRLSDSEVRRLYKWFEKGTMLKVDLAMKFDVRPSAITYHFKKWQQGHVLTTTPTV